MHFRLLWQARSIFMQNCFIVSALQHGCRENRPVAVETSSTTAHAIKYISAFLLYNSHFKSPAWNYFPVDQSAYSCGVLDCFECRRLNTKILTTGVLFVASWCARTARSARRKYQTDVLAAMTELAKFGLRPVVTQGFSIAYNFFIVNGRKKDWTRNTNFADVPSPWNSEGLSRGWKG